MTNTEYTPITECQWIGPEQEYPRLRPTCCAGVVAGRAYCEEHLWQVYQKGTNLRKRHRDLRIVDHVRQWETLFDEAVQELEDEGFL